MKYCLIGKHASNKSKILDYLEDLQISVARPMSNAPSEDGLCLDAKYDRYSTEDVLKLFRSRLYVYMTKINPLLHIYKGLSYDVFDKNDVFAINQQDFPNINKELFKDVVFVWCDDKLNTRIRNYVENKSKYAFEEQEELDSQNDFDFVKNLYNFKNAKILYFTNENPNRIATILYTLIKYPDLLDLYIKNFQ